MARYKLLFPITDEGENCLSIVEETLGVVSGAIWHSPMNSFTTIQAAHRKGKDIKKAMQDHKPCPCPSKECVLRNPKENLAH